MAGEYADLVALPFVAMHGGAYRCLAGPVIVVDGEIVVEFGADEEVLEVDVPLRTR
jgi:hypothetical protein